MTRGVGGVTACHPDQRGLGRFRYHLDQLVEFFNTELLKTWEGKYGVTKILADMKRSDAVLLCVEKGPK